MIRDLPPETEWFRPPKHLELRSDGDTRCFLWVCEITKRDIYGVSYKVSSTLEFIYKEHDVLELLKQAAKAELYRRIELEERRPEGSHMDVFMWVPCLTRAEDGTVSVGNWDAVDIEIGPHGTIRSHNPNIDLNGLYLRPGQIIPVDGDPSKMTPEELHEAVRKQEHGNDQVGPGSGA